MKVLIITASNHMGNTRKIAEAMAEAAPDVTVVDVEHARDYTFRDFDIIGFGSGVYFGKPDTKIVKLLEGICDKKAYAFTFSTSGADDFKKCNGALADLLKKKNKIVLGEFGCRGFDKFFIFKLFGGLNKGRPNADDLKDAQKFILDVMKKYEELEEK